MLSLLFNSDPERELQLCWGLFSVFATPFSSPAQFWRHGLGKNFTFLSNIERWVKWGSPVVSAEHCNCWVARHRGQHWTLGEQPAYYMLLCECFPSAQISRLSGFRQYSFCCLNYQLKHKQGTVRNICYEGPVSAAEGYIGCFQRSLGECHIWVRSWIWNFLRLCV